MSGVKKSAATAGGECTAIIGVVEQKGLAANASHEIARSFARQVHRIDAVNVIDDRTIRLESRVKTLMVAERCLGVDSEMIRQTILDEDARINSARFSRRYKALRRGDVFRRIKTAGASP